MRVAEAGIPLRARHPLLWHGQLEGKGRWRFQTFPIEIRLPPEYPAKPPLVRFLKQPVPRHPNVSPSGYVCLNHLLSAWTPINNLVSVWDELEWLLENPNYKSGFVPPGYVEGHHARQLVNFEPAAAPVTTFEDMLARLREQNRRRFNL
jgi:hypothetical protein